jgi:hypothetical protein
LDLTSSAYFPGGVLGTATDGMYPTTTSLNPRLPSYHTNYDWSYATAFRPEATMSYQVTQVESPHRHGSMHSGSPLDPPSLSPMDSSIDMIPSPSVKLERSSSHGSQESTVFPPLSPHLSDTYQHSNAATFGSSQSSDLVYSSDDGYVLLSSRASSDSPVMVDIGPVRDLSSSPRNDSSQPKKTTARNPTRRRSSKEKRQVDNYMDQPFTHEKPARKSQNRDGRNSKKIGGREKGSHLDTQTAEHARKMRALGSCWVCICQREKVNSSALFGWVILIIVSARKKPAQTYAFDVRTDKNEV